MAARGPVAKHITSRVYQARRLDPSLTFKQAAHELGISLSSLSKMRAGTRTGGGSIRTRVMEPPTTASGRKQAVSNSFTVRFTTADGSRVASRNVDLTGARTKADALLMRHDPKVKRVIQRRLAQEEKARDRRVTGSPVWRRRERQGLQITEVQRTVRASKPSFLAQYHSEGSPGSPLDLR